MTKPVEVEANCLQRKSDEISRLLQGMDGGFGLVEGVVGGTDQRSGFDVFETHLLA